MEEGKDKKEVGEEDKPTESSGDDKAFGVVESTEWKF